MAPVEIDEHGSLLDADSIGRRPSKKGFLSIGLVKYLEIVEWAGRTVRSDKRGFIPESSATVLEQLGIGSQGFLDAVMSYAEKEKYFEATERQGKPDKTFDDLETSSIETITT